MKLMKGELIIYALINLFLVIKLILNKNPKGEKMIDEDILTAEVLTDLVDDKQTKLEKWFDKWLHKKLTGRAIIELKRILNKNPKGENGN